MELSNPVLNLSPFPNVTSKFVSGLLTLNFNVGGSQIIPIQNGNNTLFIIIMDKTTVSTWHAPVIADVNIPFGNYFSIGTNTS